MRKPGRARAAVAAPGVGLLCKLSSDPKAVVQCCKAIGEFVMTVEGRNLAPSV